jgi:hypothetical protein
MGMKHGTEWMLLEAGPEKTLEFWHRHLYGRLSSIHANVRIVGPNCEIRVQPKDLEFARGIQLKAWRQFAEWHPKTANAAPGASSDTPEGQNKTPQAGE